MAEEKRNVFLIWEDNDLVDICYSMEDAEKALAPGQEIEPAVMIEHAPCENPEPIDIPF